MSDKPIAVLDASFVLAVVDPNHPVKAARKYFKLLVSDCWQFVWHERRLVDHYQPVLKGLFVEWDRIKNELEEASKKSGKHKLVKIKEGHIKARKLTPREEKEIRRVDKKDLLLFEIARGARASVILSLEEKLQNVVITGIKVQSIPASFFHIAPANNR